MASRIVSVVLSFGVLLLVLMLYNAPELTMAVYSPPLELSISKENQVVARKLLLSMGDEETNRVDEMMCSKDDIRIYQGPMMPLPNGIPMYSVQVLNVCVSGCTVSNIHVNCGWFSSAMTVNPSTFKRLDYDDCLVNNGAPLRPGEALSFQYANSFRYPLVVSSVTC